MGARDRRDDGEAEAAPLSFTALVAARKALEGPWKEGLAEPGAIVHHVQLDGPVLIDGEHGDRARAVAQSVVDEIGQSLLEPQAVGRDNQRVAEDHRNLPVGAEAAGDVLK